MNLLESVRMLWNEAWKHPQLGDFLPDYSDHVIRRKNDITRGYIISEGAFMIMHSEPFVTFVDIGPSIKEFLDDDWEMVSVEQFNQEGREKHSEEVRASSEARAYKKHKERKK